MDLIIKPVKIVINIVVLILALPVTIVVAMFQSVRDAIRNVRGERYINSPGGQVEFDKMYREYNEEFEAGMAILSLPSHTIFCYDFSMKRLTNTICLTN